MNLLQNIATAQRTMPVIRVGGNSQYVNISPSISAHVVALQNYVNHSHRDKAIYDASLTEATAGSCPSDSKAALCIGKTFFDSYGTFPGAKYSHGFNLAMNYGSHASTLSGTVPLVCKAISPDQLNVWEYGNEPNLYIGKSRPADWNEEDYVKEWQNGADSISSLIQKNCPDHASVFMAPSLSGTKSSLNPVTVFNKGLNKGNLVKQISVHNYISGAKTPGVSMNTLLSHSITVNSINAHVALAKSLSSQGADYILGEHNSLYNGGAVGISNTFGAALWVVDVALYSASTNVIKRLHYHQSIGAAYTAWTPSGNAATHPPYYGKLAAATFLGDSSKVFVKQFSTKDDHESTYAAYEGSSLVRLAVLNMREHAASASGRQSQTYTFQVKSGSTWELQRLTAMGSDSVNSITFNGFSYEYSSQGKPSQVNGVPSNEKVVANSSGLLSFSVKDSEAVVAILTQ